MKYYDRKGRPLDVHEYIKLFEDMEYRIVANDEIPATTKNPASRLSTVWLGIDHGWFTGDHPVLFETMRFSNETVEAEHFLRGHRYHPSLEYPDPDGDGLTEQTRYYTEEQASLGHKLILRKIQETEMQ